MKYCLFISMAILSAFSALTAQNRLYVRADAAGSNNGLSWPDAYTDLQTALQSAQAGDEIWVAEGTYLPTPSTDRGITFELSSGIRLYGGFAGGETNLSERDWAAHPSLLSGDIGTVGDSTDNSFTVLYLFQSDSTTLIDGFTICHGLANDVDAATDARDRVVSGGGLYIDAGNWDAFPTVRNCRFWHNTAQNYGGGAMVTGNSVARVAPRIENCRFEENHCLSIGGGVARFGGSWLERGPEFEGCTFSRNVAELRGGGLYYSDSQGANTIKLDGCTFDRNRAIQTGGGAYFLTGKSGKSGLSLQSTVFEGNTAVGGAAIMMFTNGNYFDGEIVIDSCLFLNNGAMHNGLNPSSIIYGDQLGTLQSTARLSNTRITGNTANTANILLISFYEASFMTSNITVDRNTGGTLFGQADLSSATVQNSIFALNKCSNIGYFNASNSIGAFTYSNCLFNKNIRFVGLNLLKGALLHDVKFKNCTVTNNDTLSLFNSSQITSLFFENTLMDSPVGPHFFDYYSNYYLSNSRFDNFDCNSPFFHVNCGPGNIFGIDPMFRDSANGDYSLLPCSPLINAGSNAAAAGLLTDITGMPRIQGGTVDIGAYEAPAFALAAQPTVLPACSGTPGGAITLLPANGCEPYTYQWQPPVGNGPEVNQLPAGNYSYTVTDGSGRTIAEAVSVPQAPSPVLAPTAQDVPCGAMAGGSASVTVSSGTTPYSYLWGNGATTSQVTMLPAGQYPVTVTDFNGCRDSAQVAVSLQGQITLMVDGEAISCFGASDAMLSAAPVNGKAPFSYLWSQGDTGSLLTDVGPGVYTVTTTDFYGCTATFTFTLGEPALLQATATATPTSSLSSPNGSASLTSVSGGTQAYQYLWSTGGQGQAITGLAPGIYTVTVTDAHACTATATAEVKLVSGTGERGDLMVRVWPNPMQDKLELEALGLASGAYRFVLRDGLGRPLAEGDVVSGRAVLAVGGLPDGVYFWELGNGDVFRAGRVVK